MMREAYVFLTEGFEEIEALTVLDVLRRAQVDVVSVSLAEGAAVTGAHRITVMADMTFASFVQNEHVAETAFLVLPGGPGTAHYKEHVPFMELIKNHHQAGGRLAAICAAPAVLGRLGLLEGRTAVCYPGFEPELTGARIGTHAVETDCGIITSKGPATSLPFALALVGAIKGSETAEQIRRAMQDTA